MSTPIKVSDFDLSPGEMKTLVEGAQKYLTPQEDPADLDKPFKHPLDVGLKE